MLAEHPSDVKTRTDLGILYFSSGRLDQALTEFRRALQIVPNDPVASYNLAATMCASGDAGGALEVLEPALELAPHDATLHYGKGCALDQLQRRDEAKLAYQAALELDPHHAGAWYGLGIACQASADEGSAMYCFARVMELDPEHPSARHMLSALAGCFADKPPPGFIRGLFDSYAKRFDQHLLETLGYQAPRLLLEALHPLIGAGRRLDVLDLGCGTGIFGAAIRPHAARLVGVDLSPAMLAQARNKSIYDELIEADIVDYMSSAPTASFDLVSATDVCIYLGDLRGVVRGAHKVLGGGGLFAFSVEADRGEGYTLGRTGRYRHSAEFLTRVRKEAGLEELVFTGGTLRTEAHAPCEGFVVVWQKPA